MLHKPKYFLSIVCIVKDESSYLEEFVSYYAVLGADHFFIYDNGSEIPVQVTLRDYLDVCTITPFPGASRQLPAYQHFIVEYSYLTRWAAFVDVDEFILPKKHATLKEFLEECNADAVGVNWVMFGDNGYVDKPEGLVIESFLRCMRGQASEYKTVAETSKLVRSGRDPHFFVLTRGARYVDAKGNTISDPFNENPTIDVIQINHYWTKSYEEFAVKLAKGFADRPGSREVSAYEELQKTLNEVVDTRAADRYSASVRAYMHARRSGKSPSLTLRPRRR